MAIQLRALRLPDDYPQLAEVLNTFWTEPTTAEKLQEGDAKLYAVGRTWKNEGGLLEGYDRERVVAVDGNDDDAIVGYGWSWRAPWTEPGYLCNTIVVKPEYRGKGVGGMLVRHIAEWAVKLGASALMTEVWDDDAEALHFAERRGFAVDRHTFQSTLAIDAYDDRPGAEAIGRLEGEGLRFVTLADEPGEESERKLYEMYRATLYDIPGYMGEVPDIVEWRKWYLFVDGYRPDLVIVAADGERYVGVTHLLHNEQTQGMYHEYTGVDKDYRGRGVAFALKAMAARVASLHRAPYIRTDNDSLNAPILAINRKMGYKPLRGRYRILAPLEPVAAYGSRVQP